MSLILTEYRDAVAVVTLNHAEKRNALSHELIEALIAAIDDAEQRQARVMILRAPAGSKVFSAGHDVHELPAGRRDPLTYGDPLRCVIRRLDHAAMPIIAMVEGSVWGGACELVIACDIILATRDVTFAITPAKLGVPYNLSGVLNFMDAVPLNVLREMLYTAAPLDATRACNVGMINRVVDDPQQLEPLAMEIAGQICANAPRVVSTLKQELRLLSEAAPVNIEAFEQI